MIKNQIPKPKELKVMKNFQSISLITLLIKIITYLSVKSRWENMTKLNGSESNKEF